MQNRREFLKISAAGSLGMMLLSSATSIPGVGNNRKSFGVGIQLYSIRDAMSADVRGTLKKVSDIGYKNLELAVSLAVKIFLKSITPSPTLHISSLITS